MDGAQLRRDPSRGPRRSCANVPDAVQAEAEKRKATVVITVVDDRGHPQVGIDKARTAAIYRRPSQDFEDQVKSGRVSPLNAPHVTERPACHK
jgi:uncharacterized protein GlcG (DUF336 family)